MQGRFKGSHRALPPCIQQRKFMQNERHAEKVYGRYQMGQFSPQVAVADGLFRYPDRHGTESFFEIDQAVRFRDCSRKTIFPEVCHDRVVGIAA